MSRFMGSLQDKARRLTTTVTRSGGGFLMRAFGR